MGKLCLYYHTLKYLKARQILYRVYYRLRKPFSRCDLPKFTTTRKAASCNLVLQSFIPREKFYWENSFTFLNRTLHFSDEIDWQFMGFGKLWCYNLNYFDFLNQEELLEEEGLRLITHFLKWLSLSDASLEPYPTSLRIINWIKFLASRGIQDERIDESLYAQAQTLSTNIEYHLLGNHLMENAFALLFAGCYFCDEDLCKKAAVVLHTELAEQILADGGHFELSPMYHQIILDRLLDCINVLRSARPADDLLVLLEKKASVMLGWLTTVTFRNGDIPLVNDAAFGIAPTTAELTAYAARLELAETALPLKESGYRKITRDGYEMVVDVGNIGPDYIPGHAHSDTFSFVLYLSGKPFIIDTGTSTYETCERRLVERRTAAHNTVQVDNFEQSEVWGSFRVARRAYVRDLTETGDSITACHTGYDRIGARHTRDFRFTDQGIVIKDTVNARTLYSCSAYLHFHPDIRVSKEGDSVIADGARLTFSGASDVNIEEYHYAPQFNVLVTGKVVRVSFRQELVTTIMTETR